MTRMLRDLASKTRMGGDGAWYRGHTGILSGLTQSTEHPNRVGILFWGRTRTCHEAASFSLRGGVDDSHFGIAEVKVGASRRAARSRHRYHLGAHLKRVRGIWVAVTLMVPFWVP